MWSRVSLHRLWSQMRNDLSDRKNSVERLVMGNCQSGMSLRILSLLLYVIIMLPNIYFHLEMLKWYETFKQLLLLPEYYFSNRFKYKQYCSDAVTSSIAVTRAVTSSIVVTHVVQQYCSNQQYCSDSCSNQQYCSDSCSNLQYCSDSCSNQQYCSDSCSNQQYCSDCIFVVISISTLSLYHRLGGLARIIKFYL